MPLVCPTPFVSKALSQSAEAFIKVQMNAKNKRQKFGIDRKTFLLFFVSNIL